MLSTSLFGGDKQMSNDVILENGDVHTHNENSSFMFESDMKCCSMKLSFGTVPRSVHLELCGS